MANFNENRMANLQLRIPQEFLKALEALESMKEKKKSEFVREAILEKLKREKIELFEQQWIQALQKESAQKVKARKKAATSDEWSSIEAWESA